MLLKIGHFSWSTATALISGDPAGLSDADFHLASGGIRPQAADGDDAIKRPFMPSRCMLMRYISRCQFARIFSSKDMQKSVAKNKFWKLNCQPIGKQK